VSKIRKKGPASPRAAVSNSDYRRKRLQKSQVSAKAYFPNTAKAEPG